jgi:hypothetical protein
MNAVFSLRTTNYGSKACIIGKDSRMTTSLEGEGSVENGIICFTYYSAKGANLQS